jgi:Kdo2-lipid IVA lauroyltransferase/acyltransferase
MCLALKTFAVKAIMKAVSWLPMRSLYYLARFGARITMRFPSRFDRIIQKNIKLCFGGLPKPKQKTLIHDATVQAILTGLEMNALWQKPLPRLLSLVHKVEGEAEMQAAIKQHKGLILLGPHLGAWELVNVYLAPRIDVVTLYRPPKQAALESIIKNARERSGNTMVPTDASGVKALYRALSDQKVIGLLPDQDPGDGAGEFVPFFNVPTRTMTLIARLIQKSQAPVFFVYAERINQGKGAGYHIRFVKADDDIYKGDVTQTLSSLSRTIEQCVRPIPEQYQWSYKRFKSRPEGEEDFYKGL